MNIIKKDPLLGSEFFDLAKSLHDYMQKKFKFECEPKIFFHSDTKNANYILGKTGYYDLNNEEIHVFITNRHPKDILRSYAHELMHHIQGCEGMTDQSKLHGTSNPNYVLHDEYLKHLEADAFERGNIAFREWEAYIKEGNQKMDNIEEKKKKNTKIPKSKLAQYKIKVKDIADDMEKQDPKMPDGKKYAIASKEAQDQLNIKEKEESMKEHKELETKQEEVVVNDSLKNSLTYQPQERIMRDAFNKREEQVYEELLKKFGIKK